MFPTCFQHVSQHKNVAETCFKHGTNMFQGVGTCFQHVTSVFQRQAILRQGTYLGLVKGGVKGEGGNHF